MLKSRKTDLSLAKRLNHVQVNSGQLYYVNVCLILKIQISFLVICSLGVHLHRPIMAVIQTIVSIQQLWMQEIVALYSIQVLLIIDWPYIKITVIVYRIARR